MALVEVVRGTGARGQQQEDGKRAEGALHVERRRGSSAYRREKPWKRRRCPLPETGTYSPWRKLTRSRPVRTSTPMMCRVVPAYAIPSTTTTAPEIRPPALAVHKVAPERAERQ